MQNSYFSDKCTVVCDENQNKVVGEVIKFNKNKFLIISINRNIRLEMSYDRIKNIYIGNAAGLIFTSLGPEEVKYNIKNR